MGQSLTKGNLPTSVCRQILPGRIGPAWNPEWTLDPLFTLTYS